MLINQLQYIIQCNVCGKSFDKVETFKVSLGKLNVFYVN